MELGDWASLAGIIGLVITLGTIAFSVYRYLSIQENQNKSERFATYHQLLDKISKGEDERGLLKSVSQIAYIHEMKNFPEYSETTEIVLNQLLKEWKENHPQQKDVDPLLVEAVKYATNNKNA